MKNNLDVESGSRTEMSDLFLRLSEREQIV